MSNPPLPLPRKETVPSTMPPNTRTHNKTRPQPHDLNEGIPMYRGGVTISKGSTPQALTTRPRGDAPTRLPRRCALRQISVPPPSAPSGPQLPHSLLEIAAACNRRRHSRDEAPRESRRYFRLLIWPQQPLAASGQPWESAAVISQYKAMSGENTNGTPHPLLL